MRRRRTFQEQRDINAQENAADMRKIRAAQQAIIDRDGKLPEGYRDIRTTEAWQALNPEGDPR